MKSKFKKVLNASISGRLRVGTRKYCDSLCTNCIEEIRRYRIRQCEKCV